MCLRVCVRARVPSLLGEGVPVFVYAYVGVCLRCVCACEREFVCACVRV